jgi:hypothetical protein
MDQNNKPLPQSNEAAPQQPRPKRPNETGSISVEGFVKIFDPNTNEKFVEKRA